MCCCEQWSFSWEYSSALLTLPIERKSWEISKPLHIIKEWFGFIVISSSALWFQKSFQIQEKSVNSCLLLADKPLYNWWTMLGFQCLTNLSQHVTQVQPCCHKRHPILLVHSIPVYMGVCITIFPHSLTDKCWCTFGWSLWLDPYHALPTTPALAPKAQFHIHGSCSNLVPSLGNHTGAQAQLVADRSFSFTDNL